MSERLTEIVQIRAPRRLTRALDAEAKRRMIPKSVLVRWLLAERLGLIENRGEAANAEQVPAGGYPRG